MVEKILCDGCEIGDGHTAAKSSAKAIPWIMPSGDAYARKRTGAATKRQTVEVGLAANPAPDNKESIMGKINLLCPFVVRQNFSVILPSI